MRATFSGEPIELCLPAGIRQLPVSDEIASVFETMQGRIERALGHLYNVARDLLEPLRDRVAVTRTKRDDFQNQEIERALR